MLLTLVQWWRWSVSTPSYPENASSPLLPVLHLCAVLFFFFTHICDFFFVLRCAEKLIYFIHILTRKYLCFVFLC